MIRRLSMLLLAGVIAPAALGQAPESPTSAQLKVQYEEAQDIREVRRHVESIFEAFIAGDYDTVRATHTTDWRGIRAPNSELIRGIDGYMAGTNRRGGNPPLGYEFLEIDIKVEQDYATILYLARYFRADSSGSVFTYVLRSIDTYRRDPTGWNQCGSVIRPLLDDPVRVPSVAELLEFWPPASLVATRRGGEALESPGEPLQPVDPAIAKLNESMLHALEHDDGAALDAILTSDWHGFGISSATIECRGASPSAIVRVLKGQAQMRNLRLLDQETQVRGETAVAFFVAGCEARLSPGGPEGRSWLAGGATLRFVDGQWQHAATHLTLIPLVSPSTE